MTYVNPNYKSRKALIEAIKAGHVVDVFEPGLGTVPIDGIVYLKGPHYPEAHRWYATGTIAGGKLVKVK
jgi:hypothetical protein